MAALSVFRSHLKSEELCIFVNSLLAIADKILNCISIVEDVILGNAWPSGNGIGQIARDFASCQHLTLHMVIPEGSWCCHFGMKGDSNMSMIGRN